MKEHANFIFRRTISVRHLVLLLLDVKDDVSSALLMSPTSLLYVSLHIYNMYLGIFRYQNQHQDEINTL